MLGAEDAIDADGDQRAGEHGDRVEVGGLVERIEKGEQEQAGDAADDGARGNLGDHESAAAPAVMPFSEVALAMRTGGHSVRLSAG